MFPLFGVLADPSITGITNLGRTIRERSATQSCLETYPKGEAGNKTPCSAGQNLSTLIHGQFSRGGHSLTQRDLECALGSGELTLFLGLSTFPYINSYYRWASSASTSRESAYLKGARSKKKR